MFGKKSKSKPTYSKQDLVKVYREALENNVPLEKIDQKVSKLAQRVDVTRKVESTYDEEKKETLEKQVPLGVRVFSIVAPAGFVLVGLFLIGSALIPILWNMLKYAPQLRASQMSAPIPSDQVLDIVPQVIAKSESVDEGTKSQSPVILDVELDYTNLSNWFETPVDELAKADQSEDEYIIDIPELDIQNAVVTIGGTDLNKSLIQYPGTADPGTVGAPVIFGHSVLRQFYNPSLKNPKRYNSIFSTIMTLSKGDQIFIKRDGVEYEYKVIDKTEVKPEDTFILAQRHDVKLLKLVTCTPEGTYLRRGVVTAQLVEN